jgi:hypothetical protein
MAKAAFAETVQGKVLRQVPASMSREIGRITVAWAHLEGHLEAMSWELLGLDSALGRIAIRAPRPKQQVEMIRDLAEYKKLSYDTEALRDLLVSIEAISARRDLITHGQWGFVYGTYFVLRSTGNWPKQPVAIGAYTGSRRVMPEGVKMNLPELRTLRADIVRLLDVAKALEKSFNFAL